MDLFNEIEEHLNSCKFGPFKPFIEKIDKSTLQAEKRYFNDHKVTDHHALVPTIHPNMENEYIQLSEREKNVFDAVVTSFIAIFYPEYEYNVAEIITDIDGYCFQSKGTSILSLGYKEVLKMEPGEMDTAEQEEKQVLPILTEGDSISVDIVKLLSKMTQAPKRYSVSSLISVMEKYSIGTSATRADIIKKLQNPKRTFITMEKGKYISTQLGRDYIKVVPEELKNPELTAEFESQLQLINQGMLTKTDFLNRWEKKIMDDMNTFETEDMPKVEIENESYGKCPVCRMGEVTKNRNGYGCSQYKEGCKFMVWGTNVKPDDVRTLLAEGKTKLIKGFVSKDGKTYNASLKLNDDGTVGKVFENSAENAKWICPKCKKGKMVPSMKAYSCDQEACKFIIWKTIAGKTLSESQLQQLIEKRKTGLIKGFKSKAGKPFDAKLILKEDGSVGMEFAAKQ